MPTTVRRTRWTVRDSLGWPCGHLHQEYPAAVRCKARDDAARLKWGPTGVTSTIEAVPPGTDYHDLLPHQADHADHWTTRAAV